MEGFCVIDFFQIIFGDFYGKLLFILVDATQYTIYLSLTAFAGGGLIGLLLTLLTISDSLILKKISTFYIWLFQSIPLLMLLFIIGLVNLTR